MLLMSDEVTENVVLGFSVVQTKSATEIGVNKLN